MPRPLIQDTLDATDDRAAGEPRAFRLLVLHGDTVQHIDLPRRGEVTVGRDATATVRLPDDRLSRLHLRITLGEAIAVTDLGSRNGTRVRRERIEPGAAVVIRPGRDERPGDPIEAGSAMLFVQAVGAPAAVNLAFAPAPQAPADASGPLVLDPAMVRLYALLARVAEGEIPVLLLGETGVGKEFAAEHVHARSRRAAGPFLRLNCASLAGSLLESELFGHEKGAFTGAVEAKKGLLESADGGTVFLDELGELPMPVQVKLLRVLEERKVTRVGALLPRAIDVRFVSATNRDLQQEIARGNFREDLYFRLNGIALEIPPLRDRPTEIIPLAQRMLQRAGRGDLGFSPQAQDTLRAWRWPGNVRELRNVVSRAALLCGAGPVEPEHLALGAPVIRVAEVASEAPRASSPSPAASVAPKPAGSMRDEFAALERQRILDALAQCHGNQTRAAKLLGMPRRTFVARLDAYEIPRPRKGLEADESADDPERPPR